MGPNKMENQEKGVTDVTIEVLIGGFPPSFVRRQAITV